LRQAQGERVEGLTTSECFLAIIGGMIRPARLATVCAVAALATLSAQEPQQPPTFRGRASLVRVDVTVSDRHGEPVTSLNAADFEVTEDGVAQTVETFKLVSADG